MGQGRNSEALLVLQKIYQINTGQPKDNYPVSGISNNKIGSKYTIFLCMPG